MSGKPGSTGGFGDAQRAYSVFLNERQQHGDLDLEDFCARRPELADDLRKLDAGYRLGQSAALSRSFQQAVREHFGDVPEVTVRLDAPSSREVTVDLTRQRAPHSGGALPSGARPPARERFGRYDLEDEVSRGGMGAIYKVTDRDLSRTLAMKVMLEGAGTESRSPESTRIDLARFVEEAQVTAQLDHPGVVPVHELGFDPHGRVYFTMKLVKGRELGEIFALAREEKDGWNLPRAVGVVVKACQALAYAHAKKVVHRDLKPANIMAGRFGEVYVMDWGLAKVSGKKDLHDIRLQNASEMTYTSIRSDRKSAGESSADSPLITMDGSVVGTPAYMPPEQAKGQVEDVDPASDVYSLGAILYNLLTGQAPYLEPKARISPHTVLARVLDGPPKRVRELNPHASPELAAICEKAMARNKKDRYASSLDMAEDLQAYLDHRVVQAYRTGAVAEFKSWVARNKGMAASAAAALLLALSGLLIVTWVQIRAQQSIRAERDIAIAAQASEETAKTLAETALAQVTAERDLKNEALEDKTLALSEKEEALRQAEGLYLTGKASQELATRPGRALMLAVEGVERQQQATGFANEVLLKSLEAERELLLVEGTGEPVGDVAYSPGGALIALAQGDTVRLVEGATGEAVRLFLDPLGVGLSHMAFSPDGTLLAVAASYPPRTLVFEAPSGRLVTSLRGHQSFRLESIAFSHDGSRILTASHDGTARVHRVAGGVLVSRLEGHECGVEAAAFSPDSARVLTASSGSVHEFFPNGGMRWTSKSFFTTARVWDADSGAELFRIGGHLGEVEIAAFSPDGARILTRSRAGIRLHDAATGTELEVPGLTYRLIPSGAAVVSSGGAVGTAADAVAPSAAPGAPAQLTGSIRRVHQTVFTPEGDVITLGVALRRWSIEAARELWSVPVPRATENDPPLRCSPDGRFVALLDDERSVALRDAQSGALLKVFRGHISPVTCFRFRPDSRALVSGSRDGTARVWDTDSTRRFADLDPAVDCDGALSVAFSPGGDRVLVTRAAEHRLVERKSGRELHRLELSERRTFSLLKREFIDGAFFTGGGLVSVSRDGLLRLWDDDGARFLLPPMPPTRVEDLDVQSGGEYLAALGSDGAVRIVGVGDSRELIALIGKSAHFARPRFTPDGTRLIALGSDVSLREWAVPSGRELRRLDLAPLFPRLRGQGGGTPPEFLIDPTGSLWLFAHSGGLAVLEAESGTKIAELDQNWRRAPRHVEWAQDGEWLLVVVDGRILVADGRLALPPHPVGEPATYYHGATFSPDGRLIAALSSAATLEVIERHGGATVRTFGGNAQRIRCAAFSPDGRRLLIGTVDGSLDLRDLAAGGAVRSFSEGPPEVSTVSFSLDGSHVLAVGNGAAHLWETSGKRLRTLERADFSFGIRAGSGPTEAPAFSSNGSRLLAVVERSRAVVWDLESGKLLLDRKREADIIAGAALAPRGDRLFLASRHQSGSRSVAALERRPGCVTGSDASEHGVEVVDVSSGSTIAFLRAEGTWTHPERGSLTIFSDVTWWTIRPSSDGQRVAAASDSHLVVWDTTSGAELFRAYAREKLFAFSPDGLRLVYLDSWGLQLWDSTTGSVESLRPVQGVSALAFSPDGSSFLETGSDGDAHLWKLTEPRSTLVLKGHQNAVTAGIFSADGRWIATASADETVRIWKAADGSAWLTLPHEEEISAIAFSADASEVLTVAADKRPRAWPIDLLAAAKAETRRRLSAEEREFFRLDSPEARETARRREELEAICAELRLVAELERTDPFNLGARQHCGRLATRLRALFPPLARAPDAAVRDIGRAVGLFSDAALDAPELVSLQAELLASRGDLHGAVRLLETASQSPQADAAVGARLVEYRQQLLPDLASYASIDAVLETTVELVPEGATWRYFKGTGEPSEGLEWTTAAFDDSAWESGPSGIGYGDGDDATVLEDMRNSYTTVYIRHVFERPPDVDHLADLTLRVSVDDGFVAYLNGTEIGRSRTGASGTRMAFSATASSQARDPSETVELDVDADLLADTNVLALQGLNRAVDSSDLTLIPVLVGHPRLGEASDRARFARFQSAAAGEDAAPRRAYLEARLLERGARYAEAAARFEAVGKQDPAAPQPLAGLVRCLKASGRLRDALSALERALQSGLVRDPATWDEWFRLSLVDLSHPPRQALGFLERLDLLAGPRRARDLHWALDRIVRVGALRLNAGDREYHGAGGVVWADDRFFSAPSHVGVRRFPGVVEGTEDAALYESERHFSVVDAGPHGYRIPVPPGSYRVTLGFAEVILDAPSRRFHVSLEGERVLERYVPQPGRADRRSFERQVVDGFIDVTFDHIDNNPMVSMIEVERLAE